MNINVRGVRLELNEEIHMNVEHMLKPLLAKFTEHIWPCIGPACFPRPLARELPLQ